MYIINPFAYLYYHLYLLQLEEYDSIRFLRTIWHTKGIPQHTLRKKLVFTPKAILIAMMTIAIIIGVSIAKSFLFLAFFYVSFLPIVIVVILLTPLDSLLKNGKVSKAKKVLGRYPNLKVIGIAGSYGKTTMKEVVSTILSQKLTILKTPENINTPLGIADLIINHLNEKVQVLIVEMGEYQQGDIEEICHIVKPQIGVITGINEAHLERMGNIENTVSAIFELAQMVEENGLLVLNDDNEYIHSNYKNYVSHKKTVLYSSENDTDLKSGLLGRYAKGVLQAGKAIASYLGVSESEIRRGAALIKALPHRLQPIEGARDVLVIDDSYNGNPTGVTEAIYVLGTYKDRRKVYITPGLVETGGKAADIHRKIGTELSAVANLVILITNSVTPYIQEGLIECGFNKENIRWYESTEAAHADLANIIQPNDVVLFQNDWTDNYS
jgi:UDP-N-acetylmuramoyl-tripeptide--D-alanyl-D-alanine ligase